MPTSDSVSNQLSCIKYFSIAFRPKQKSGRCQSSQDGVNNCILQHPEKFEIVSYITADWHPQERTLVISSCADASRDQRPPSSPIIPLLLDLIDTVLSQSATTINHVLVRPLISQRTELQPSVFYDMVSTGNIFKKLGFTPEYLSSTLTGNLGNCALGVSYESLSSPLRDLIAQRSMYSSWKQ